MREREPIELTTKPVDSTLNVKGNIFMSEPGGGEIPQDQKKAESAQEKPRVNPEKMSRDQKTEAQRLLSSLTEPDKGASLAERRSYEMGVRAINERFGIPVQAGAEDFKRTFKPSSDWQEIPDGLVLPAGATVRMDQESGKNYARWDNPPDINIQYEIADPGVEEAAESEAEPAGAAANDGGNRNLPPVTEASPAPEEPTPDPNLSQEDQDKAQAEAYKASFTEAEADQFAQLHEALPGASEKDLAQLILGGRETMSQNARIRREAGYESGLPESLEDLAQIIMDTESDIWKEGGERALINEKGEVVKENFLAWVRKRMWQIDDFNPLTNINLFSDIYVKKGYMQISLYEMVLTGSYFLKKEQNTEGRMATHKDNDYEKLKQEIIREVFTYNTDKNASVTYVAKMGEEKDLGGLVIGLWAGNPNLRADHLEHTLTLPSTKQDKIAAVKEKTGESYTGHETEKILEENMDLGEGIRRAFLTYFHIGDIEMLEKIHGADSVLFNEKYFEADEDNGVLKTDAPEISGVANDEAKEKKRVKYKDGKLVMQHDRDGNLIIDDNLGRFIDYINVYNDANKDSRIVDEVRLRIREYLVDSLGLDYEEARFAETWAYNKTRPMLVGARNDTRASAFDAASRNLNTMYYRDKQNEKKRKGQIGNIFDIGAIKRTSLTPLEEITDIHGRSVIEAIQGGQGSEYSAQNPFDKTAEGYKTLRFGQDEGLRWASMAFGNGDAIKNILIQGTGFNIESLLTYDEYGRQIIDQEKADKFLEEVQKRLRYRFSTYAGADYSKTVRIRDQKKTPIDGKKDRNGEQAYKVEVIHRDMPMVAGYFGTDIINFIKSDIERVKIRIGATDEEFREGRAENVWSMGEAGDIDVSQIQNPDIREYLWKQAEKVLVARKLEAHRNVFSELQRYNYAIIERFYDFFKTKGIYDDEDIKEVRKMSKTSQARLLAEEIPSSFFFGVLAGAWAEIKRVVR